MKIRLSGPIDQGSIVDGPGLRAVIWTQGCRHACKGCHNPETHSFDAGVESTVEEVIKELDTLQIIDGITLSGGDPLFQPEASLEIVKYAKGRNLNVWMYTGFTFEQLLNMSKTKEVYYELLENIDVLIDGKFELSKKNLSLQFRGSTNQRVVNVKKSLKQKKAVQIRKYKVENKRPNTEFTHIFI